MLLGPFVKICC